jgi:hypothetical protein
MKLGGAVSGACSAGAASTVVDDHSTVSSIRKDIRLVDGCTRPPRAYKLHY